jgi:metal-responsive CopG/Arc/MetJ family transcriptional regulator
MLNRSRIGLSLNLLDRSDQFIPDKNYDKRSEAFRHGAAQHNPS